MKPTNRPSGEAASANITKRIEELGDWRGETLAHVRQLIHDADSDTRGGQARRSKPGSHQTSYCYFRYNVLSSSA